MIALALLAGCLQAANTGVDCAACHGSTPDGLPPPALGGNTDTAFIGVGAHASHEAVNCSECHHIPNGVDDPEHIDPWPAEVTWGPLSETGGLRAWWEHSTATCTVYCHGATLDGGTLTEPVWTQVDGTQAACGACHGLPPPPPHVTDMDCVGCHSPTAGPDGTIADTSTHVDGIVQVGSPPEACGGCHGSDENPAPPPDTTGSSDRTDRGVGAHAAHIDPANGKPVPCEDCHTVPATSDAAGHIDASPAEVVFGGIAAQGSADPVWDANALTCSDVYCHGATLSGGDVPTPTWTDTDGAAAECGACHSMPPPSPHPSNTNCSNCHAPAGAGQTIDTPNQHVDGGVDL